MPTLVLSLALPMAFPLARFFDLALAHPVGAGKDPDATCTFKLDECAGSRRDPVVACSNALAASTACWMTDRWFSPQFSFFVDFSVRQWTAEVSCPGVTQRVWPACSTPEVVQDIWDIYRES